MTTARARIVLQAQDTTAPAFNSLRQRLGAAKTEIAGLASGFAGVAAGFTALLALPVVAVGFVRSVNEGLVALKDLSDATGASVENLSALEDIAERTGTSFDTVGDALVKFNQALNNSADPKIAAVFKAVGVSIEDLKKQDPALAFVQFTKALDGFAEGGSRSRAELQILGRSIRQLAPLIRDFAEAGELNATVTAQQVEEADKFNKQLSNISKSATDAARQVAGPLVSALNEFFEAIKRGQQSGDLFGSLRQTLDKSALRGAIESTVQQLDRMAPAIAAARAELDTPVTGFIDALQKASAQKTLNDYNQLTEALKRYRTELDRLSSAPNAGGGRGFVNPAILKPQLPDPRLPDTPTRTRAAPDPIQALIDSTSAARTEKLIGLRKRLTAEHAAGRRSATDYARGLQAIDEALAALQPKTEAATDALGEFIEKIESARSAELSGIVGQSTGARFEALALQAQLLSEAFQRGEMNLTDFTRGAEVLGQQFEALEPRIEQVAQATNAFAEQASRNLQDALGNTLESALSGNFDSIADLWKSMITRMVAEAAAANIMKYLFGGGVGSGEGKLPALFNLLSSFASVAGGSGTGLVPGRPRGGAATGSNYIERDMLTILHKGEAVIPKAYNPAAGGGRGGQFQVVVQGDASENTVRLINGALAQFEARMMMRGA